MLSSLVSKGLFALLLISLHITSALAFFPVPWREWLVGNFGVDHQTQTNEVYELLAKQYFPDITSLSKNMKKARDTWAEANAEVDKDQHASAKHFDGENFAGGQARLTDLFGKTIAALQAEKAQDGRVLLGQALHTIQDFYSHSNWIEMGNLGPNPVLGRGGHLGGAGENETTCGACGGLDTSQLLHLSIKSVQVCLDCSGNEDGYLSKLTSGYYYGEDRVPQDHKCHHGGPFDNFIASLGGDSGRGHDIAGYVSEVIGGLTWLYYGVYHTGINKDSLSCQWSPHGPKLHRDAVDASKAASSQYIDDLKTKLTNDQLRMLFGVGRVFAFVMDTTGSMSGIQRSVAKQAEAIARNLTKDDGGVGFFVISPFNDPSTGPVTTVTSIESFDAYMDSLPASGGGDCPELSNTGILNALDVVTDGTQLFMFTNAAPKDADLDDTVVLAALEKHVNIHNFKLDSGCDDGLTKRSDSLSNKIYGDISARTGGTYHSLPESEIGSISGLLEALTASDTSSVLQITDTVSGTAKSYTFAVDSKMTKVAISFNGAGASMTYTASATVPTSAISTTNLKDGVFASIQNPPSGTWTINVSGSGSFNILVTGSSPLDFTSFKFVESTGRDGHGGFFRIADSPPHNVDIGGIAEIDGDFSSASFDLRTPAGAKVMDLPINPGSGEYGFPAKSSFFGTFRMPQQDVLVYAAGVDKAGAPFQRLITTVVTPVFSNTTYRLGTLDAYEALDVTVTVSNSTTNSTGNSTAPYGNSTTTTFSTTAYTSSSTLSNTSYFSYPTSSTSQGSSWLSSTSTWSSYGSWSTVSPSRSTWTPASWSSQHTSSRPTWPSTSPSTTSPDPPTWEDWTSSPTAISRPPPTWADGPVVGGQDGPDPFAGEPGQTTWYEPSGLHPEPSGSWPSPKTASMSAHGSGLPDWEQSSVAAATASAASSLAKPPADGNPGNPPCAASDPASSSRWDAGAPPVSPASPWSQPTNTQVWSSAQASQAPSAPPVAGWDGPGGSSSEWSSASASATAIVQTYTGGASSAKGGWTGLLQGVAGVARLVL